jgi:acyl-CoA thioester hydrolase
MLLIKLGRLILAVFWLVQLSDMHPQLSTNASTNAIQPASPLETWFEYPIRVQPHHTDYAGIAWHGTYVTWLEEARVEYLRSVGIEFAELVAAGCNLPVVELAIRYHRSLPMGASAVVRVKMLQMKGVRINLDYQIQSPDYQELYVTAQVTLVAVDQQSGKIMRRLPASVAAALAAMASGTA